MQVSAARLLHFPAVKPVQATDLRPHGTKPESFFLPGLDALRAMAWAMVLFSHLLPLKLAPYGTPQWIDNWYSPAVSGGSLGVVLFFTLSAFLITTLLLRERESSGTVDIRSFYFRRVLRIWPLYFLVLGLAATGLAMLHRSIDAAQLWRFATLSGNLSLSSGAQLPLSIAILWSVCIEEQFYLCWPWVVRFCDRRSLAWAAAVLVLAGTAFRMFAASKGWWFHSLSHLDAFGYGCFAALCLRGAVLAPRWRVLLVSFCVIGVFAVHKVFPLRIHGDTPPALQAAVFTLIPLLCALLVWCASMVGNESRLGALGKRSYGLYCYHGLVLDAMVVVLAGRLGWLVAPATIVGTLGLAWVSYRYFEMPFLRLKQRIQVVRSGAPGGGEDVAEPAVVDLVPARA